MGYTFIRPSRKMEMTNTEVFTTLNENQIRYKKDNGVFILVAVTHVSSFFCFVSSSSSLSSSSLLVIHDSNVRDYQSTAYLALKLKLTPSLMHVSMHYASDLTPAPLWMISKYLF